MFMHVYFIYVSINHMQQARVQRLQLIISSKLNKKNVIFPFVGTVINKRGQVRPKRYNSKFKRFKVEEGGDVKEINSSTPLVTITEEEPQEQQHEERENNPATNYNEPDVDAGSFVDHTEESSFMDFIKEQDETFLDDLIRLLEAEQKWNIASDDAEDINLGNEDEEDEEEEDKSNIDDDMPIEDGHFLTVKTSVLLIWLLAMTHSFTAQMLADTLTVINLHLLVGYPALKSVYRFKRYFGYLKSAFIKHHYCSFCLAEIEADEKVCPNGLCGKTLTNSKEYFLELPILSQLNAMFTREEFREGLKYKSQRVTRRENNIEDVYDCENYKVLFGEKKTLNENNESHLSFIFNTDGIPIFKSSKTSIWPIFLMVNELPYRMRKSRENMLMCGLWFGKSKPDMNMFCNFFHQSLLNLQKGVIIEPKGTDQALKIMGICTLCHVTYQHAAR
ncbi:uncharacterized protein LOC125654602 isoform X1 [Ostrea edulis]|uniref:uncharacterized protein LOC125654602 isoform X1 n=1 Tax=Ostrea edulis TaxID=37623 RepID=UPI0024AF83FD|nr:uncharacterized protein LOC125654602 isoform X1 [Ostrea edulis]